MQRVARFAGAGVDHRFERRAAAAVALARIEPQHDGLAQEWHAGTGAPVDAAIYPRATLPPGARIAGPAVIVEAETSTLVPDGFTAGPNAAGHLLIERTAR